MCGVPWHQICPGSKGVGREQLTKPMDHRKGDPAYTSEGKATRARGKRKSLQSERRHLVWLESWGGEVGWGWGCFGSQAEKAKLWPREEDELVAQGDIHAIPPLQKVLPKGNRKQTGRSKRRLRG